jgi:Na+-translocating ferredoxin:NAD+ oxidoreductase RnfG subunit
MQPDSPLMDRSSRLKSWTIERHTVARFEIKKWRAQFVGKTSKSTLKLDSDIKNISGATLSCRHITDGVKRLLAFYEIALKH